MQAMNTRLRTTAGLAESDACGGGVRPNEQHGVQGAASNEAGKPTCESRSPMGEPMGRCQEPPIISAYNPTRSRRVRKKEALEPTVRAARHQWSCLRPLTQRKAPR